MIFLCPSQLLLCTEVNNVFSVELRIGFETMKYTVSERERNVTICLNMSASLQTALTFYTMEGTALGTYIKSFTLTPKLRALYIIIDESQLK